MSLSPRTRRRIVVGSLVFLLFFFGWPIYNTRILVIRHEDVRILSGDVELAATISMPRWGKGPFPALVSVHGSGPLGREHYRGDWRNLVPEGIVVLTYDKRGVGESSGDYESLRSLPAEEFLRTLATDAAACFDHLKKHPRVDPRRVGFFGGSQASWIIPLASDGRDDVAFNVVLAGSATSTGLEHFYSQLTGDGHRPSAGLSEQEIQRRVGAYDGPAGYDPLPVMARSKVPSLWLLGEKDLSTPAKASAANLTRLSTEGVPIDFKTYPNASHGLDDVTTGNRMPYWEDTVDWLRRQGILPR
jgi:uncharacterized protein